MKAFNIEYNFPTKTKHEESSAAPCSLAALRYIWDRRDRRQLAMELIDSAFVRFNTIITSLKDLGEGYSSKNYVRKFLKDLHPKWRAKVTVIEESKDLTSLSLDESSGISSSRES
ncbi:hypothetical protein Tco_0726943 [Tanacetum coccineum]|uniref:UBN2 domain-containing protein n=1 Tax=Tanacetum coccineum TaxID=301880 RepID=A0ABQ4YJE0_9ASTR